MTQPATEAQWQEWRRRRIEELEAMEPAIEAPDSGARDADLARAEREKAQRQQEENSELTPAQRKRKAELENLLPPLSPEEERLQIQEGRAPGVSPAQPPPVQASDDSGIGSQRFRDAVPALLKELPFVGGPIRSGSILLGGAHDYLSGAAPTWADAVYRQSKSYEQSDKRFKENDPALATFAPFAAGVAMTAIPGAGVLGGPAGKTIGAAVQRVGTQVALGELENASRGKDLDKGLGWTAGIASAIEAIPFAGRAIGQGFRKLTGTSKEMAERLAANRAGVGAVDQDAIVSDLTARAQLADQSEQSARSAVASAKDDFNRAAQDLREEWKNTDIPADLPTRLQSGLREQRRLVGEKSGEAVAALAASNSKVPLSDIAAAVRAQNQELKGRGSEAGQEVAGAVQGLYRQLTKEQRDAATKLRQVRAAMRDPSYSPSELAALEQQALQLQAKASQGLDPVKLKRHIQDDIDRAKVNFPGMNTPGGAHTDLPERAFQEYRRILTEHLERYPPYAQKMQDVRDIMDVINSAERAGVTEQSLAAGLRAGPAKAGGMFKYQDIERLAKAAGIDLNVELARYRQAQGLMASRELQREAFNKLPEAQAVAQAQRVADDAALRAQPYKGNLDSFVKDASNPKGASFQARQRAAEIDAQTGGQYQQALENLATQRYFDPQNLANWRQALTRLAGAGAAGALGRSDYMRTAIATGAMAAIAGNRPLYRLMSDNLARPGLQKAAAIAGKAGRLAGGAEAQQKRRRLSDEP